MEKTYEDLCSVISDLDAVSRTLDSLRRRMEITTQRTLVDGYYKILLTSKQIKEDNEILKSLIRKTEGVNRAP